MSALNGVVIKSTGSWYKVLAADGNAYDCRIKGKFRLEGLKSTNPIAIGDKVHFEPDENAGNGIIYKIEKRKNFLIRKSPNLSRQTHIIAANIDHTLLVVSLKLPKISTAFIDRFIVISQAYEIEPVILFNKIDLYSARDLIRLDELMSLYKNLGYQTLGISALNQENIDSLWLMIKNRTSLLIGQSGVGKSTILNILNPELSLKTREISDYHKKGTHTTSFYEMHQIMDDTFIIDSPGIRELGLHDFEAFEISLFFPEMKEKASECKFSNCLHIHEPGCAIIESVENGMISEERYLNYLKILEDFDI